MQRLFLKITALACSTVPQVQADAIDDYVRKQMARQHIPGLALAVIKDSKPIKVQGYGVANLELNSPTTPDTVFKIGSVSKQFIASGIMLLVDQGKLSLGDSIAKHLSDAPEAWKEITLHQVLAHTSGLPSEPPGFNPLKTQDDAEVISSAYKLPLAFKPGQGYQYSNLGYFVLAEIIRKASGEAWSVFIEESIFNPAGMRATGTIDQARVVSNRADGYVYRNGRHENAAPLVALRPSGAFASSINDLIRWDASLSKGSILSEKSLESMVTPLKYGGENISPYGLGWVVEAGKHRHVYHDGRIAGFRSQFSRYVDDRITVIVLANIEIASADAFAFNIAGQYIPGLVPEIKSVSVPSNILDGYVGSYTLRPLGLATVQRDGNALIASFDSMGLTWRLLPTTERDFVVEDEWRLQAKFVRKDDEAEPTLTFILNGRPALSGTRTAR